MAEQRRGSGRGLRTVGKRTAGRGTRPTGGRRPADSSDRPARASQTRGKGASASAKPSIDASRKGHTANPAGEATQPHPAQTRVEQTVLDFAERLGHLVGEAETQWQHWAGQRETVIQRLTTIRDRVNQLLTNIGQAAETGRRKTRPPTPTQP